MRWDFYRWRCYIRYNIGSKSHSQPEKVAAVLDKFLGGNGYFITNLAPFEKSETIIWFEKEFTLRSQCKENFILPETITNNFCLMCVFLDEKTVIAESERCLKCDLRLYITQVKF